MWSGRVTVTEVRSPHQIWAVKSIEYMEGQELRSVAKMKEDMEKSLNNNACRLDAVTPDTVCAYQPDNSGHWYRARVLRCSLDVHKPLALLRLIDHGIIKKRASVRELYHLPAEFSDLRRCPPLAVRVRLTALTPLSMNLALGPSGTFTSQLRSGVHWADAARTLLVKTLPIGSLCKLNTVRIDSAGTHHGRLATLLTAQPIDLATLLVQHRLACPRLACVDSDSDSEEDGALLYRTPTSQTESDYSECCPAPDYNAGQVCTVTARAPDSIESGTTAVRSPGNSTVDDSGLPSTEACGIGGFNSQKRDCSDLKQLQAASRRQYEIQLANEQEAGLTAIKLQLQDQIAEALQLKQDDIITESTDALVVPASRTADGATAADGGRVGVTATVGVSPSSVCLARGRGFNAAVTLRSPGVDRPAQQPIDSCSETSALDEQLRRMREQERAAASGGVVSSPATVAFCYPAGVHQLETNVGLREAVAQQRANRLNGLRKQLARTGVVSPLTAEAPVSCSASSLAGDTFPSAESCKQSVSHRPRRLHQGGFKSPSLLPQRTTASTSLRPDSRQSDGKKSLQVGHRDTSRPSSRHEGGCSRPTSQQSSVNNHCPPSRHDSADVAGGHAANCRHSDLVQANTTAAGSCAVSRPVPGATPDLPATVLAVHQNGMRLLKSSEAAADSVVPAAPPDLSAGSLTGRTHTSGSLKRLVSEDWRKLVRGGAAGVAGGVKSTRAALVGTGIVEPAVSTSAGRRAVDRVGRCAEVLAPTRKNGLLISDEENGSIDAVLVAPCINQLTDDCTGGARTPNDPVHQTARHQPSAGSTGLIQRKLMFDKLLSSVAKNRLASSPSQSRPTDCQSSNASGGAATLDLLPFAVVPVSRSVNEPPAIADAGLVSAHVDNRAALTASYQQAVSSESVESAIANQTLTAPGTPPIKPLNAASPRFSGNSSAVAGFDSAQRRRLLLGRKRLRQASATATQPTMFPSSATVTPLQISEPAKADTVPHVCNGIQKTEPAILVSDLASGFDSLGSCSRASSTQFITPLSLRSNNSSVGTSAGAASIPVSAPTANAKNPTSETVRRALLARRRQRSSQSVLPAAAVTPGLDSCSSAASGTSFAADCVPQSRLTSSATAPPQSCFTSPDTVTPQSDLTSPDTVAPQPDLTSPAIVTLQSRLASPVTAFSQFENAVTTVISPVVTPIQPANTICSVFNPDATTATTISGSRTCSSGVSDTTSTDLSSAAVTHVSVAATTSASVGENSSEDSAISCPSDTATALISAGSADAVAPGRQHDSDSIVSHQDSSSTQTDPDAASIGLQSASSAVVEPAASPSVSPSLAERCQSRGAAAITSALRMRTDLSPSSEAHLRVLVQSDRRVTPWWRPDQVHFDDIVQKKLRQFLVRPTRVQAFLWPAVSLLRPVVCVGPANSGKTLGYLVPIVDRIVAGDLYDELPAGSGPVCICVCASWRRAVDIHLQCQALTDSQRCHSVLVHGGGAETEQHVHLLNGCHVLVGTLACVLRLIERGRGVLLQLNRVCHLVLDDADVLIDSHMQQLENLMVRVNKVWLSRGSDTVLPGQTVAIARNWNPGLRGLVPHLRVPAVITSSYIEQLVFSRPKITTHILQEHQKDQLILDLSRQLCARRLVVFTSSDEDSQRLWQLLDGAGGRGAVAIDGTLSGHHINDVERAWLETPSDCAPVLVVSDRVLGELSVRTATALLLHDLPESSPTQLGLRCSFGMDAVCDPDRTAAAASSAEGSGCEVHLLLDERQAARLGDSLSRLLRRCGAPVPQRLADAVDERRRAGESCRKLCPQLRTLGRCRQQTICAHRHWLHKALDQSPPHLPTFGEVTVSVTHVHDAGTVWARLVSVRCYLDDTGTFSTRSLDTDANRLDLQLVQYYSHPDNRLVLDDPQSGDMCGLDLEGSYVRVSVVDLNCSDGPLSCTVQLTDQGSLTNVLRSRLLVLPTELAAPPASAVLLRVCCVAPVDGDVEWVPAATRHTTETLAGKTAVAKIVLSVCGELWVSPLVRLMRKRTDSGWLQWHDTSLKLQLKQAGLAEANPTHLDCLYRLMEAADMPVLSQWRPADRRRTYTSSDLPVLVPLLDNCSVNITTIISPDHFYIQRNDIYQQYEELMVRVNTWASSPLRKNMEPCLHAVGQHCIAQFHDQKWYRACVLAIHRDTDSGSSVSDGGGDGGRAVSDGGGGDGGRAVSDGGGDGGRPVNDDGGGGDGGRRDSISYDVFFTDVGDRARLEESLVLPLPGVLATQLPLQAIRCRLACCSSASEDGSWTDAASDYLYDLSLDEQQMWKPFHCKVAGRTSDGVYEVLLYNEHDRVNVLTPMVEAGHARIDHQALMFVDAPQFGHCASPSSCDDDDDVDDDIPRVLDSDDSSDGRALNSLRRSDEGLAAAVARDSPHETYTAEGSGRVAIRSASASDDSAAVRRADLQKVLDMVPKEDGLPIWEVDGFECVGFPFTRFGQEVLNVSSSSGSIEVIDASPGAVAAMPATNEFGTAIPASIESSASIPASTESCAAIPASMESGTAIPASTESSAAIPASTESSTAIPALTESSAAIPASTESSTAIPASTESSTAIPASTESVAAGESNTQSGCATTAVMPDSDDDWEIPLPEKARNQVTCDADSQAALADTCQNLLDDATVSCEALAAPRSGHSVETKSMPPPLVFPAEASETVEAASGLRVLTPTTLWHQDRLRVTLQVLLPPTALSRRPALQLQNRKLNFRCELLDCVYKVDVTLAHRIDPSQYSCDVIGPRCVIKLLKDPPVQWRRLTASSGKQHWLKYDPQHIGDDDSSSDEAAGRFTIPADEANSDADDCSSAVAPLPFEAALSGQRGVRMPPDSTESPAVELVRRLMPESDTDSDSESDMSGVDDE